MLIGYGQPILTPSVQGASAVNLAALVDGRPASVARISGDGSSVRLRADWTSPVQVGIVALLGVTCPAGTALTLTGRRQAETGYAYPLGAEVIRALVDESRAAWFVLPMDIDQLVGLQLEVSASNLDVGELVILQAVDVPIQVEWEASRVDPSSAERTLGGGLNVVPRRSYRRLQVALVPEQRAAVRGAALAQGMDWDRLTYALGGNARSAVIPRWGGPGAINRDELHRTALFGRFTPGSIAHRGGDYYASNGWIFEEIPPI
ncbi:hypothetical protein [Xanthomonas cucurbitae]|uniref:Uncharacterized protein n=1 Tax=Xanthomonas cucurbitae TaxID=56453 RepID=A0ABY7YA69_9XANT|nr:hypothetical protein [Xanthomonas cucurbitae]WDM66849.1 hypothetical protein K6981_15270 [Xanthomonas cucurbitae]WDM70726.1 hypothetical protein K6978_15240 [Xanthomonas cucurbitae]